MAKSKKASLKVARKTSHAGAKQQSNNPFEIHTNKRKHDVLGRKMRHERGLPGISRSKAIKKRQKTLLVEYKQKNKANMFIDHRFGEYDEKMSLEEKMLKRFTMEKKHHHERRGLYALEDEELTHLGQSLGEIGKFDDIHLSEDDDNDEIADDDAVEDVKELHFGGFLKKKKPEEMQSNENEERHKSKKEIMEEVVAKAKIKKHERQMAKEETVNLTDQLDKDWKSVKLLISQRGPHSEEQKVKSDDYDIAVRQLAFEIKGKATDRLKSELELAKEEQARLEKLELQRKIRMKGLPALEGKPKHVSADDLGDSFTPVTDERVLLSYEEGSMINVEGEDVDEELSNADDEFKQDGDEEIEGQEVEHSDSDDNDDDEEEEEEGSDEDDDGSDLESEGSDDETEETDGLRELVKQQQGHTDQGAEVEGQADSVRKDLPYTFQAPKSFAEFQKLITGWSCKDQLTIVDRIKACHNPKITPDNKPKMEAFLGILLEFVGELSHKGSEGVTMIDKLSRSLFDVAQHSPVNSAKHVQEIIKKMHKKFTEDRDRQGGKGTFLGLSELLYLRIVPMLFSASDLKHAVCTPAMLLMSQVLAQSPVRCIRDVFRGLFICDLFIEFLSLSKRFVPETVNFLCGILFLASNKEGHVPQLIPPFKPGSKCRDLLTLESDGSSLTTRPLPLTKTLGEGTEIYMSNDEARVSALSHCLRVFHKFVDLYKDLPASFEIFSPVKEHLQRIQLDVFPATFKELHSGLLEKITNLHTTSLARGHLTLQTRKPEAIRTFEPKFEENYEWRSRRGAGSKKANEKQKLKYKYKKEFKGAVREIRKDNQFLAKQKLQDQLQRDAERMRKVKEIEHMLSNQQAETNAVNRKKRKLGK